MSRIDDARTQTQRCMDVIDCIGIELSPSAYKLIEVMFKNTYIHGYNDGLEYALQRLGATAKNEEVQGVQEISSTETKDGNRSTAKSEEGIQGID